jgi:hypothetical protein
LMVMESQTVLRRDSTEEGRAIVVLAGLVGC